MEFKPLLITDELQIMLISKVASIARSHFQTRLYKIIIFVSYLRDPLRLTYADIKPFGMTQTKCIPMVIIRDWGKRSLSVLSSFYNCFVFQERKETTRLITTRNS